MDFFKKRYFIKLVFLFVINWLFLEQPVMAYGPSSSDIESVIDEIKASELFVAYLTNVASFVYSEEGVVPAQTQAEILQISTLLNKIDTLFEAGAFKLYDKVKTYFYNILIHISNTTWPTPSLVKSWHFLIDDYLQMLRETHFLAAHISVESIKALENELVLTIILLSQALKKKFFTQHFFKFSLFEKVTSFIKDNALMIIGSGIVLGVGSYLIYKAFYKEKEASPQPLAPCIEQASSPSQNPVPLPLVIPTETEIEDNKEEDKNLIPRGAGVVDAAGKKGKRKPGVKIPQDKDCVFVLGKQNGADCSVHALYRQWCHEQVEVDDIAAFKKLSSDKKQYNQFKSYVVSILKKQEDDRLKKFPVKQRAKERRKISTDWLENDDLNFVLEKLSTASGRNKKFKLSNPCMHVRARNMISPDFAEEILYEDTSLKTAKGEAVVYGSLDAARDAGRQGHCAVKKKAGLRYEDEDLKNQIENFVATEGAAYDFIINTNEMPQYEAGYKPKNEGHFFHIRAIRDSQAEDGIRFVVSETLRPNRKLVNTLLGDIRFLLRPYED